MSSAFSGLSSAKTFERGQYLDPGDYTLEIEKCFVKSTRSKGDAFIVEFKVLASTNEKHPVGASRNWYQGMRDKDIAFGAIKEFLAAVFKVDLKNEAQRKQLEAEIEKTAQAAVTENALKGVKVAVSCFVKKTKEKGEDFTVHSWKPAA